MLVVTRGPRPEARNAILNLGVEPVQILILISRRYFKQAIDQPGLNNSVTSTGNFLAFSSNFSFLADRFSVLVIIDEKRDRAHAPRRVFRWLIESIHLTFIWRKKTLPLCFDNFCNFRNTDAFCQFRGYTVQETYSCDFRNFRTTLRIIIISQVQ